MAEVTEDAVADDEVCASAACARALTVVAVLKLSAIELSRTAAALAELVARTAAAEVGPAAQIEIPVPPAAGMLAAIS